MILPEYKLEEITVIVKCPCSGQQQTVDLPIDFNLGDFRREAQEVFGIPKSRETFIILEATNEVLSNEKTFRSAAIQNNAVLVLMAEVCSC
jgi:hypothetical protein